MRRVACHALLAFVVLLAGCGGDDESAYDLTDPQAVMRESLKAVHDGDWPALSVFLTKDARHALEADMRKLHTNLVKKDKTIMRVVAHQLGDGADAAVAEAIGGGAGDVDMRAMLRFFVKLSPREREPKQVGMRLDNKGGGMQLAYVLANGEQRAVTLIQARGRWYVANLQL